MSNYEKLNIGDINQESRRLSADGQNSNNFLNNFVRMPEGNGAVTLRFLPPSKGASFYCATRTHRMNGRNVHCPRELEGSRWLGQCSVCEYYNWLWRESEKDGVSADEADAFQTKARSIKPIERYYYNVIVRSQIGANGETEENVGPKIYSCGKTVHKMIIRAIVGDEELGESPLGDISDLVEGRDFKLIKRMRKSGSQSYPNYNESKFLEASPLGTKDSAKEWLAGLHDLSSLRSLKTEEELKHELKMFLGVAQESASGGGFDPSEFKLEGAPAIALPVPDSMKSQEGVGATSADAAPTLVSDSMKTQEDVSESSPTSEEVKATSDDGGEDDEVLADDDFLKELRNLG